MRKKSKKWRQLTALALGVCLFAGMQPEMVRAQEATEYQANEAEALTEQGSDETEVITGVIEGDLHYNYDPATKTLVYSGTSDVTERHQNPLEGKFEGEVEHIKFDSCKVLSLGHFFRGMCSLKTVDFEGLDTSNVINAEFMFSGCSGLTTLDLSNLDTSSVKYMTYMFTFCESLTTLDLSNLNTANVTSMYGMFYECNSLTTLDLSNLNTSSVVIMSEMFMGCESLTTLDISNMDTSNVTHMSHMFWGCSGLTTLNISNMDTSNVTEMDSMFADCGGLTTLDISNLDTSNVTNMNGMFWGCSGLTTLDISNLDTTNVTDMGGMFAYCIGVTALDVRNMDTSNVTDMSEMFVNCRGLTTLDISNMDTSNVTDMSEMFRNCRGLTILDISNMDTSNVTDMSDMFWNCNGLTTLDISNMDTSNVTNMQGMFEGCSGIKALDLSNMDTSKVENMAAMFSECKGLPSLDLSSFDASNVSKAEAMFLGCEKLDEIKTFKVATTQTACLLPGYYVDNEEKETDRITAEFTEKLLTKVRDVEAGVRFTYISEGYEWPVHVGDNIYLITEFYPENASCTTVTWESSNPSVATVDDEGEVIALKRGTAKITVKTVNGDTATCVVVVMAENEKTYRPYEGAAYELTYVVKEDGITITGYTGTAEGKLVLPEEIDGVKVVAIGDNAFDLTALNWDEQENGGAYINYGGFSGELKIPDTVTYIGDSAFYLCTDLTGNLVIPDSVTTIGEWAFGYCFGFDGSLTLSNNVTSIGRRAFILCRNFKGDLVLPSSVSEIGDNAFFGSGFNGQLKIAEGVTNIGDWAFAECVNFVGDIIIPKSMTSVGIGIFYRCSFNGRVEIPENVTSIGDWAFKECGNLTGDLVIPKNVESVGVSAFCSCHGLNKTVYFAGNNITSIKMEDAFDFDYVEGKVSDRSKIILNAQSGSYVETYASEAGYSFEAIEVEAESITLSQTTLALEEGAAATLTATITPDNATDKSITWKSSDTSVVTVDDAGKVTAVKEGTADITATTLNGKTATCKVTVTKKEETKPDPEPIPDVTFKDVDATSWQYEGINYVCKRNAMNGVSAISFNPEGEITRGQLVTILHRLDGEPKMEYANTFPDVKNDGMYFVQGVMWASKTGVTNGYPNGKFGPNDPIQRQQLAKMLYSFAEYKGYDLSNKASFDDFIDADKVEGWATDPMQWAVANKIINGKPSGGKMKIDPTGTATRAECAKMLMFFMKAYME